MARDGTTLKIAVTDSADVAAVKAAGAVPVLVKRSEQALVTAKVPRSTLPAKSRYTCLPS